ncbi:MAG: CRTAC1 family protein [Calditrichaeota bacterium]|nr:MAG: CRTAC1 family protein [Calditrichota bacterium]
MKRTNLKSSTYLAATLLLAFLALAVIWLNKPSGRAAQPPFETRPTMYFQNVLADAGIDFQHYGERHRWCEIGPQVQGVSTNEEISASLFTNPVEFAYRHLIRMNGSGAAWLDYDNDGDWDLYLVNGAGGPNVTNALYENNGDGTFTPRGSDCGALDTGEGMAVSVADYDNDGFSDIFVTNFGGFVLYHNNRDGSFSDVTRTAFGDQVKDRWYGGAAWGDYDRDGDLDLYVCGYVDLMRRPRHTEFRFPMDFEGFPNMLFRNNGDGTFTEVAEQAHVNDGYRKSMQAMFADFNEDGWPDIFVANDTDPNSLYLNKGDGTFKEFSGPSGTSSTDGSMGIAYGDYNGDGKLDLFISNYTGEADILLTLVDNESTNDGKLRNAIFNSDFNSPMLLKRTWGKVGWGTGFFDFDNDGDLDLLIANGHLNAVSGDNRDELLLFENNGRGVFTEVSQQANFAAAGRRIYRSAIFADYNNDGWVDVYVVNNGEKSYDASEDRTGVLLRNQCRNGNHWFTLRLEGTRSNRDALGSRVFLTAGGKLHVQELVSGTGYFSSNARELYFGLGQARRVDRLEIHWPSGDVETFKNLPADQIVKIREGSGSAKALKLAGVQ